MAEDGSRVVRRIKAKTSKKPKKNVEKAKKVVSKPKPEKKLKKADDKNYFAGAWHELKQVHWTNRRTTWKLTMAVILFSVFFALFVLLADWIFNWVIQKIIL